MNIVDKIKTIVLDSVSEGLTTLKSSDSVNCTDSRSIAELARAYMGWYMKARKLISNTSPDDLRSFTELYHLDDDKNVTTIAHFFSFPKSQLWDNASQRNHFIRNDSHFEHFKTNFSSQIAMIEAIPAGIEFEKIKLSQLLARDLLTDELNQARELLSRGFVECAGMLAGIALERQLKVICENSSPPVIYSDKDTLGSLNDRLKKLYIDPSDYSRVKAMKTTRDRCSHDPGTKPPAKKDAEIMISDVDEFIKNH